MSSAILYLAIVAIWAVVLVPRWLRHTHTAPLETQTQFAEPATQTPAAPATQTSPAPAGQDGESAGQPPPLQEAASLPGTGRCRLQRPRAGPVSPGAAAPAIPSSAERRTRILRARRRALSTLVLLSAGAAGLAVAHLAAWWVAVPPAVILAGFLMLLHEAARIDAERAAAQYQSARYETAIRYEDAVSYEAPSESDGQPATGSEEDEAGQAGTAHQAQAAEPGAEVIDISGRIGDQLYDQYVDAQARAIGD